MGDREQGSYSGPIDITHRCTNFGRHGDVALGIFARRLLCVDYDQECIATSNMWRIKRPYNALSFNSAVAIFL